MIKSLKYQEANFWDIYPELKYLTPFAQLYFDDDLETSSKYAWYVVLFTDPESIFINLPQDERRKELEENFLEGDSIHDEPVIQEAINNYPLSDVARNMLSWKRKLDERSEFLASQAYDENTYDMLDKMLKTTKVIFDLYNKAKTEYEKTEQGQVKGGGQLSSSDMGLI